ncbi:hypothetical protein C1Y35_19870 [Pseudomonas sp. GW456-L14]|uniref:hypothetical protein n=1 Tax=unclassified Pseudomonas TaxID=196821 RepID=UPI000C881E44|nr:MULTISPECIES: hypothetical protein [unclassified Pseudomonas]PMY37345.1 hypothetical protein C1Y35_19870 [Pseudomonas sp. GW456-L14]PMY59338.1 hypothetical protein C1Y34_02100 [Pseudomonas sp. GW456-L12]
MSTITSYPYQLKVTDGVVLICDPDKGEPVIRLTPELHEVFMAHVSILVKEAREQAAEGGRGRA